MLINMHNIHNLWSPQKCASVNAVQTGLCVELRHLAIARAQTSLFLYHVIATLTSHLAARDQQPQKLIPCLHWA